MWLFNPGNPVRGTPKTSERDRYPVSAGPNQVSLPHFFRFDILGNALFERYYPGIGGDHTVKRVYPNGKLEPGSVYGPNSKSYREFLPRNNNKLYRVAMGPALPSGYLYSLSINGEVIAVQASLSAEEVLEALQAETGIVPVSHAVRPWATWDEMRDPSVKIHHEILTLVLDQSADVVIQSHIQHQTETDEIDYIFASEYSDGASGWRVEFSGGPIGVIQRPFLLFANWIIGDLAADWQGPIWFDVMMPVDLDLYELLIDDTSNPYSPGTIIRGEFLGKTTVYPAWS